MSERRTGIGDNDPDRTPGRDPIIEIWLLLRDLVNNNDRRRQVADATGISFIRAKALRRLARSPASMRQLAEDLTTDRPYATVYVDDLERRGLVIRRPDPDDRRGKIVHITAAGRRIAEQAEMILDRPPAALDRLSETDLETVNRILRKLAD